MPLSRRAFLGSVAGACLGLAGTARAGLTDRKLRRIEGEEAKYAGPVAGAGFLDRPAFAIDDCLRLPQTPYEPQPGDVMFSVSKYLIYRLGHRASGAGEPSHSSIAFRRGDGSLALLEAGPFDVAVIHSMDLVSHLSAYYQRDRQNVWLRTRAMPLTSEQSCRLTEFAEAQEDKRFARLRLYAQVTPLRSRGPLRTYFVGGSHGPDRRSYYCAELVVESMVYAGLIDAADARPCATYPHDFFFDESKNPFLNAHFKLAPCWNPPARWRPCPVEG
jgi:hypothetical protein